MTGKNVKTSISLPRKDRAELRFIKKILHRSDSQIVREGIRSILKKASWVIPHHPPTLRRALLSTIESDLKELEDLKEIILMEPPKPIKNPEGIFRDAFISADIQTLISSLNSESIPAATKLGISQDKARAILKEILEKKREAGHGVSQVPAL